MARIQGAGGCRSFHLDTFINEYVIKRPGSMFVQDIEANQEKLQKQIYGKSILVIGGAGSIGSSFLKALLPFGPASVVVVDTDENALAELTRDLRSTNGMPMPKEYLPYPMDYHSITFRRMFRSRRGFDIAANFAAHKHVRSEKDIYSVEALFRNNVLHAKGLLDLLSEYPPNVYFCVSTDKAANPVNLMGASKRIMEDLIFSYSGRFPVTAARFANVAFSNGSLPAGFLNRIQKMQPISAPTDIKRYFVSPTESGQICMLSAMLGNNREIFFPKLEEAQMMAFDNIARALLMANGYEVLECPSSLQALEAAKNLESGGRKYPVYFSESDTSGEKPYEEFYTKRETVSLGRFRALGVITGKDIPDRRGIESLLGRLEAAFEMPGVAKDDIVEIIKDYLPNFDHIETGKALDSKM